MTGDITGGIVVTAARYSHHWHNRSIIYWFYRLLREVFELGLALLKIHSEPPEHELVQIASICINFINYLERKGNEKTL